MGWLYVDWKHGQTLSIQANPSIICVIYYLGLSWVLINRDEPHLLFCLSPFQIVILFIFTRLCADAGT